MIEHSGKFLPFIINDQHLWLSADKTIFWEEQKTLIVADIHFSKVGTFRKAGIGITQKLTVSDLMTLMNMVYYFKTERLIVVGDFFHSRANKELPLFEKWRKDFPSLKIDLVKGNHDILDNKWYADNHIEVHQPQLIIGPFGFVHDIYDVQHPLTRYYFCGHEHPGIRLRSIRAKDSAILPCFHFTGGYCVLPAFSAFCGTSTVKPVVNENIFAIAEGRVLQVS
jgi:DNA ligase-associated metallophosphoesterase